jgi:hypothetical protein
MELLYALVTDGPSDQALIPILQWLLKWHLPDHDIQARWFDPRDMVKPPESLAERIQVAIDLFDPDLLIVHRDAENQSREQRVKEIHQAIDELGSQLRPTMVAIPVRMTEAWLLIDEKAIRIASGNPNGTMPLHLPHTNRLETLPNPKALLYELLIKASGRHGRRKQQFNEREKSSAVADHIQDFSRLKMLSAFQALEHDLIDLIQQQGWNH